MDDLLFQFRQQLDQLGIALRELREAPASPSVRRATVRLVRGRSEQTYTLLYGQAIRLTEATSVDVGHPLLVFTTYVAPRTADGFRRAETQYLDTAGNAWIHFGDLLVDIRGRSNPPGTRARVSGDLFSTGRAKVLFALLAWPQLWKGPQRDLAHAAGVSVGQANNTLHLLAEAGHGPAQGRHGQTDLLDLWAAAFPTRLAERIRLAEYGGELSHFTKVDPDDAVFVSVKAQARLSSSFGPRR